MPQEPDYKAAYEILEEALRNADRILRQAQLRTACGWNGSGPADPEFPQDETK